MKKKSKNVWLVLHRTKVMWRFRKICGLLRICKLYCRFSGCQFCNIGNQPFSKQWQSKFCEFKMSSGRISNVGSFEYFYNLFSTSNLSLLNRYLIVEFTPSNHHTYIVSKWYKVRQVFCWMNKVNILKQRKRRSVS